MAREHYLGKTKTKIRREIKEIEAHIKKMEELKGVLSWLKAISYTPAKLPEQVNNWCADYVNETDHFNGVAELKKRGKACAV